ncbi:MAG: hypothetical protein JNK15_05010 [Planctomycetes bacterium]|nr:hypothetical protein [Planctomycetota bacterium]
MDQATAAFWLDVIAATAAALWLCGAMFLVRTRSRLAEPTVGEQSLPGKGPAVLASIAKLLTMAPFGHPLQRARIEAATDRELRWRSTGMFAHTAALQANATGAGCTVRHEVAAASRLVTIGLVVAAIGAVVVVTLWHLLGTRVLTSPEPAVRAQVVQMVQAVHLLWPPFLFAGLARMSRRRVVGEIERVLRNLAVTKLAP